MPPYTAVAYPKALRDFLIGHTRQHQCKDLFAARGQLEEVKRVRFVLIKNVQHFNIAMSAKQFSHCEEMEMDCIDPNR
ncbi:hypothetical protein KL86DPRO_70040 [uncultured delta proteobacterium]|uniref:Uncharacterized protein n=1 Tax=uncultured delta proteobacterium TaxID=34034 RepID=A0A212KGG4_9DELT|nr:hypothetical protein KL86DPRO_70040 [uncultured delta proteobacterium]